MKSSMTKKSHGGMTIDSARFHVAFENQLYTHEIMGLTIGDLEIQNHFLISSFAYSAPLR
jgi:hypothetical protein